MLFRRIIQAVDHFGGIGALFEDKGTNAVAVALGSLPAAETDYVRLMLSAVIAHGWMSSNRGGHFADTPTLIASTSVDVADTILDKIYGDEWRKSPFGLKGSNKQEECDVSETAPLDDSVQAEPE